MAKPQPASVPDDAPPREAPPAEPPRYPGKGFRLSEYLIEDVLGHGAMATVFSARDATGHEVALKVFQEGPGVSKTMLERFRREAEASKKLRRHPHILTIYGTGKEGPYQYIVMHAIANRQTLESAMESTPMSLRASVEIIIKIARALQYAHTRSIVHRDVKPSNIMIDEFGEPLLSDFGVAELVDWPSCTVTGALTGTPLYMSPEQARAERVGPASDIYSLGVVLFEAVTGVLPYSTQHAAPIKDVLQAVREELPKRPRLYRKEITPDLEAVMLKALEKEVRDRYIDAEAFATDLERALAGRPVSAHHFTQMDKVRHFARQNERLLTTVLLVVTVAGMVGFYFRNRLVEAHYENLIGLAWRKNTQYLLAQAGQTAEPSSEMPRAWQEIRLGRRAMNALEWETAQDRLRSGANLSIAEGDGRTASIAQLDQARSETMLDRLDQAQATYLAILKSPDSPPAVAALAQLEFLAIVLLEGDEERALNSLLIREPPSEGPVQMALRCLAGQMAPENLAAQIESIPRRFRNDAQLVVALRYYLDGNAAEARAWLRQCTQSAMPSFEWPAPLARKLMGDLGR